jgi:mono/diheme cytochrome c family protein
MKTRGLLGLGVAVWIAVLSAASGRVHTAAQPPSSPAASAPTSAAESSALVKRYCVSCHNEKLKTGGLTLANLDLGDVSGSAGTWEKVVQKLRAGVMPPSGLPRPTRVAYDGLATWIEGALDNAAKANPNPGRRPAFHRFNRNEYHNAIRDLLGLDIDVAALLPPDDRSYGFDNIGDILGISPTLLEGYMEAARKISKEAIGDPTIGRETHTYKLAADLTQDYRLDGLPFGTRGGTLVTHLFPVDGEYSIKIDLLRNFIGGVMGMAEAHQLEVSLDGQQVQRFTVGGRRPRPQGDAEGGDEAAQRRNRPVVEPDANLRVQMPVKAGTHELRVTFLQRPSSQAEDLREPYLRSFASLSDLTSGQPHVASIAISGPMNASAGDTPTRHRLFTCRPTRESEEAACARKILSSLARRAYRRPVTDEDLKPLLAFYQAVRDESGFEAGIQRALQRLLMSPEFLVRIERDPANVAPGTNYRISDLELASRLSFFLWSTIPDDELLDLAERGRLKDPAVLRQQVRRMLADSRSKAFVTNFTGQWLYLRNVRAATPDSLLFPDFDDNLRQALQRETEMLFETIVHEDRSALDLLGARYTFVNERLARHYGIADVYGNEFRRIELSDKDPRGGLLGQGSILAVTSYPNRTSPVQRGKWLLENVLGAPPPPPPPNVPDLEEKNAEGRVLSMRERMVQHRANPVCASCHSRMDPLGLALENFDAVGRLRAKGESGEKIDATGALPDGTPFTGPQELRDLLLKKPERFVNTLTERLLTYALGRGVQYYDQPAIRAIARGSARHEYRFSDLILGIVQSAPFQMRRSQS